MRKPTPTLSLATKKLFLLFVISVLNHVVLAQDSGNILPASPQSQQFFKHFDFPENNSSGAINYTVPIYEVKSGSLSLPITLSYVSGGTKYSELPGEIGYNWSLNAGGRIARTIYGKPDDRYGFPGYIPDMSSYNAIATDFNYLGSIYYSGGYDSEFDIYSYSYGNTSGKFIYNQYDSNNTYNLKAYTIPEKPYKVDFGDAYTIPGTIVDDKGITYIYNTQEVCATIGPNYGYVTAKLLNYVISADKKDTIKIVYQPLAVQQSVTPTTITSVNDNNTMPQLSNFMLPDPYFKGEHYTPTTNTYMVQAVKEIHFRGGKIIFTTNSANDAIEYIKIYDKKNTLLKQFELVRSLNNLTELRAKDINATTVEKYSFEYYTRNSYALPDFFGYLKSDGGHVRRHNVDFRFSYSEYYDLYTINNKTRSGSFASGAYGVSYSPDDASKGGMLKKVTYPTGGSAEYSYENNMIEYGLYGLNSGGMRLSEAKLTDNNGNVNYKTYKYGINGGEGGKGFWKQFFIDGTNNLEFTGYELRVFPYIGAYTDLYGESYRKRLYTSSFLPEISEAAQEATFYPFVTVYDGTPSNNTGKIVYGYNSNSSASRYQTNAYPYPDWYTAIQTIPYGWNDIEFDSNFYYRYHISQFDPWMSFPLESKTVYKNNGIGGYDIVKTIVNTYDITETQKLKGLHITKYVETSADGDASLMNIPIFLYDNYYVTTGRENLTSTTETLYTPTGNVATTTNYEYNANKQVSKSTTSESKGGTNVTTYTYANDYSSTQPYTDMVTKNMISQVVNQTNYKNFVDPINFLQSTKTDYNFWYNGATTGTPNNSIYPEKVWTKKASTSNPYVLALHYNTYDEASGNILQLTKLGGAPTSYIWGYNKQYPILEVKNATYSTLLSTLTQTTIDQLNDPSDDSAVRIAAGTLRSSLPNALVTGISYRPLVGTTSTTDPKGLITYYHYDDYLRLMNIVDKNGNLIKHIDYNYKH